MPVSSTSSFHGRFDGFNLSPKATPEGLLLETDNGFIQINFAPELAGAVIAALKPGDIISVQAIPFKDAEHDAHPVYDLIELGTHAGERLVAAGAAETRVTTRGIVQRINYARRGEANGGILDNGDFVHLRPHGAKLVGLKLGMTLEASGEVRGKWSIHRVVEADSANGVSIQTPKEPKPHEHADKPHHPRQHRPQPHPKHAAPQR